MAGENKKVARYSELYKLVDKYKPQTICEIGTWKGMRARKMLRHASYFHKNPVSYTHLTLPTTPYV